MTQLRDYRQQAGLTLEDISELSGFGVNMVSRHERGIHMPDPKQIEKYRKISGGKVTSADWAKLQTEREAAGSPTETQETTHD